jgi:hypothetical protein
VHQRGDSNDDGCRLRQHAAAAVTVSDADGVEHTFEFRSMLVRTGHGLYARERVPEEQEGYEFSVLGDFDANVWTSSGCCKSAFSTDSPSATWSEGNSAGGSRTQVNRRLHHPGF